MIRNLFPTPLGVYFIDRSIIREARTNILNYLDQSCKDPEEFFRSVGQNYQFSIAQNFCKSSNYLTYQTYDDLKYFETFKPLVDSVCENIERYFKETEIEVEDYEITSMWANVYKPGGDNSEHTHPNSFLSGVVYIEDDSQETLKFFDPRVQNYVMVPKGISPYYERVHSGEYGTGVNLVFPSWLQHRPQPYTGPSQYRITLAYNVMLRGEAGYWGYHVRY